MVISALFKNCGEQEVMLQMFKLIHPQMCQITSQILFKIYEDLMIYRSQSYDEMGLD